MSYSQDLPRLGAPAPALAGLSLGRESLGGRCLPVSMLGVMALLIMVMVMRVPLRAQEKTHFSLKRVSLSYENKNPLQFADVPIIFENGILFTYLPLASGQTIPATTASGSVDISTGEMLRVYVSGSFLKWQLEIEMSRNEYGIYQAFVPMKLRAGEYAYKFMTNGLYFNDPKESYMVQNESGEAVSAFKLFRDIEYHEQSPKREGEGVFGFFLKDADYKEVYWMGTANLWNPRATPLKLKNGYWSLTINLAVDAPYYLFVVDGRGVLDPLNAVVAATTFLDDVSVVSDGGYFLHER